MKPVHVAVGVIVDETGHILLTRRAKAAHQGGLWEFPGGKVESSETVQVALDRELHEELGIRVEHCESLLEVSHDYGDKKVCLDVWVVWRFSGEPRGREGQPMQWVKASDLPAVDFPAANLPIVQAVVARFV